MTYEYFLSEETPSKKNSRITLKNGKTIPSKEFTHWHSYASLNLLTQSKPPVPINKSCKIEITFAHSDNKRRDSDNQLSSILDLLQDCKIIADDNWRIIKEIYVTNKIYRISYCNIKITELEN